MNQDLLKFNVQDPDILDKIASTYNSKIIGETNNKKFLFCACISKDLPRQYRLSVIISSQSSAGKSNLVNNMLIPFMNSVIDYTDYTSAFLKRQTESMDGKIFKIEQMEKTNNKDQVTVSELKFLLSEGKLKMGLIEKNEKGKNIPQILEVTGIPVFISTSTNPNIDDETLNRTFLMQVDESEEQTRQITSHIGKKYSTLKINDTSSQELEELTKLAKDYQEKAKQVTEIVIPFEEKIIRMIPTQNITIRRDLPKILNLTCVIAFIHAADRKVICPKTPQQRIVDQFGATEPTNTYTVIAEPKDFLEALQIAGSTFKQTLNKINESSMTLYETIKKICKEKSIGNAVQETLDHANNESITIKEMAERIRKSENRTRELINPLYHGGFLTRDKESKTYRYYLTEKKFEQLTPSNLEFSDEEFQHWLHAQTDDHLDKLVIMSPSNRAVVS